jgi:hypothetical protein
MPQSDRKALSFWMARRPTGAHIAARKTSVNAGRLRRMGGTPLHNCRDSGMISVTEDNCIEPGLPISFKGRWIY